MFDHLGRRKVLEKESSSPLIISAKISTGAKSQETIHSSETSERKESIVIDDFMNDEATTQFIAFLFEAVSSKKTSSSA